MNYRRTLQHSGAALIERDSTVSLHAPGNKEQQRLASCEGLIVPITDTLWRPVVATVNVRDTHGFLQDCITVIPYHTNWRHIVMQHDVCDIMLIDISV